MEINRDICEVLDEKMMEYSAYVLLHRALPSLEDGFKVSLRRILYTMYKENMTKLTKSANVSGQVMKIHPHSDCYPTIVNMVQTDNHVNPFVLGKGAFAYHTSRDTQPASSRYSEVKIAPYSLDMMDGIKKNSVDMIPTFDGSMLEPVFLPTKHPNLLTHSQEGLGVGMACKFPSFNLGEVCDCTISYLKGEDMLNLVPDFSTGGYILNNEQQIDKINKCGSGNIDLQAKYVVEGEYILIKEIPYTTTREVIIEKIIELVKSGKVKEIIDIKDTTDLKGMEIEIKVKKNTNCDLLMQKLYKMTPLQSSFSANMNCLCDNKPQVLGVHQIIQEWVKFRKQCIKRELQYDIDQYQHELAKLQGLELILNDLDKAISIIRGSKSEKEAIDGLVSYFKLNQVAVDYVVTIKMVNMNNEWLTKKIQRINQIKDDIKKLTITLEDDDCISNIIIDQLTDVKKKYGRPRRTQIIHEHEVETVSTVDMVESYTCQIVLTRDGYLKKTLKYSDTQKAKDGDEVIQQFPSNNKHKLLLFTDKANVYYLNAWEVNQCLPSTMGTYLPSLLSLQDEKIIYATSTDDFKGYLLVLFENGKVAKVNMSAYQTLTNRTKVVNAYSTESPLVAMYSITKDVDVLLVSSINKVIIFNTSLVNPKSSKNTIGTGIMKSKDESILSYSTILDVVSEELEYYRINATNKVGAYLRKEDKYLIN